MVTIAASLYLPEHISIIARRAYYYIAGDSEVLSHKLAQTAAAFSESAVPTAVKETVEKVTASAVGEL